MTQPSVADPAPSPSAMGRGLRFAMAVSAGLAAANIYYNQPMLGMLERQFPPGAVVALVTTATQLGFCLGIVFLLPLADVTDRRKLIVAQFIVLAFGLAGAALAPSAALLLVASLVIGASGCAAQQIVPFAAALAPPRERGAVLGVVMSGLLCGILLSRTLAGFVSAWLGWRAVFWLGIPLSLGAASLMAALLPRNHPHSDIGYARALRSVGELWLRQPDLRLAALTQAALFGVFSVFWTTLALRLQGPPLHMGPAVAGLFGLLGAAGVLAAPLAGRAADRRGPRAIVLSGSVLTAACSVVFGLWGGLGGLIVGVIVLDFGVQIALIGNQHIIYALDPAARGRVNTVFMGGMFLGGAVGSAGAAAAWAFGGWPAVSVFGGGLGLLAVAVQLAGTTRRRASAVALEKSL